MQQRLCATFTCLFAALAMATPAWAQYGARPATNRATGENYHVEIGGFIWSPTPDIVLTSEGLGIPGTPVDFVNQLGIVKKNFNQFKVVLRPGTKHKFRFEYTPVTYDAQAVVQQTFVFNGIEYHVGVPVTSKLQWKAYRFGYEWDFVYRDRGFAGLILEAKYTDVQATLTAAFGPVSDVEFTHARAPIPAIGFIGRGYVAPNISITGEFSAFKLPDAGTGTNKYSGKYYDLDVYGTVNFSDHLGAEVGYRSWDLNYVVKTDNGTMTLKGVYFGGKARF